MTLIKCIQNIGGVSNKNMTKVNNNINNNNDGQISFSNDQTSYVRLPPSGSGSCLPPPPPDCGCGSNPDPNPGHHVMLM